MHMTLKRLLLATLVLGLAPWAAQAQSTDVGEYVIHYNAFTTDSLVPAVAQAYGITRSPNQVLLNVTVLKKVLGTTGKPVRAEIEAFATNLNNQMQTISMREVDDQGAFYHLGTLTVTHGETLTFRLDVTPAGSEESYPVKFQKQFYVAR